MAIDRVKWQLVCCAWHGDYAEHPLVAGGVARLKRGPARPGVVLVCRFGPDNKAIDTTTDDEGNTVPAYVEMTDADADALLG